MAKKQKKEKPKKDQEELVVERTKQDEDEFPGGISIDLNRKLKNYNNQKLGDVLSAEIFNTLDTELKNQEKLVQEISELQKLYMGMREEKMYPYPGSANTAIPLTYWLTKTLAVRVLDTFWGQKKLVIVESKRPEYVEFAKKIEDAIEWWQSNIAKLKKNLTSPLLQSIKFGTGIAYLDYKRKKRTIYRRATEEELKNPGIKKYRADSGNKLVKVPITAYDGVIGYPIPREDFVMSSDSNDIDNAFLVGFRTYLREPEIKTKIATEFYYKDTLERLGAGDRIDDLKKQRAEEQGKEIKDEGTKRYEVWKLYVRFDVDDDGEEDDIVVTFHKESKTIMRAIYNPNFYGFRPLQEFVGDPIEFSFDGQGVCKVIKPIQLEVDSVHNQRLDRMNQINSLVILKEEGADLGDVKIFPGAQITVPDIERSIRELRFSDVYHSTFAEEALLNSYAEKATGVTPHVMGMSTSERPVARETMVNVQEANKKFKSFVDNYRGNLIDYIKKAVTMFGQYQPRWEYYVEDNVAGAPVQRLETVDFPPEALWDCIDIKLMASSEIMNEETRREQSLVEYQLLNNYMTQVGSMAQAITSLEVPPEFKLVLLEANRIGVKLMKKILQNFGEVDEEDLTFDLEKILAPYLEKLLSQQPPPPQPQPQAPAGQPPPQAPPPPQGM